MTTFTNALASALNTKLRRLISSEPALGERIEVCSLDSVGERLYRAHFGAAKIASDETVAEAIKAACHAGVEKKLTVPLMLAEWEEIADPGQLGTWEAYRHASRLGRKTRLSEAQRAAAWVILEKVWEAIRAGGSVTRAGLFTRLAEHFSGSANLPYDFAVVDEAQDIGVAQLRFLASVTTGGKNSLFFAGDLGQRIFQLPFSWKALGVDVRGRSTTLKINYRTSHQIRGQADRLLGLEVSDVDGNKEERKGTISLFNGPAPLVVVASDQDAETQTVAGWLRERVGEGLAPQEISVFVRSDQQIDRARRAVEAAGLPLKVLDERVDTTVGRVSICTMHLAKGLEFRAVAVMACDDEVIPLRSRMESVTDDSDLEEVYSTERQLLYVACTRARDHLVVTAVKPASEFLDDLRG